MPDRFAFDVDGELYEVAANGFHIIEVSPLNEQAADTHWPYGQQPTTMHGRQPSLARAARFCHACGCRVKTTKGLKGEYYYCWNCIQAYEKNPTACPGCGHKLSSDWDGPYCLNCGKHYYKVAH